MDVLTFFTVRLCPWDMHLIGVPTAEDIDILLQDINNLCQWSKDWQMLFNVKKCKVLHIYWCY